MSGAASAKIAMETRLRNMGGLIATQWENTEYKPVADIPYQQVNFLLADPNNPEWGGYYQDQGYIQISLRYPTGGGAGDAYTMAQTIRDWFKKDLQLVQDGVTVTVSNTPTISSSPIDGDRYVLIVRIKFFANNSN